MNCAQSASPELAPARSDPMMGPLQWPPWCPRLHPTAVGHRAAAVAIVSEADRRGAPASVTRAASANAAAETVNAVAYPPAVGSGDPAVALVATMATAICAPREPPMVRTIVLTPVA